MGRPSCVLSHIRSTCGEESLRDAVGRTVPARRASGAPTWASVVPVRRDPLGIEVALILRQGVDACAVLVAQAELEDVEVLDPPLMGRRLRDGRDAGLIEEPAQGDL